MSKLSPNAAFLGSLAVGAVLALFPNAHLWIWVVFILAVALPVTGLATFIVLNGLPKGMRQNSATELQPTGLGSPWLLAGVAVAAIGLFLLFPSLDLVLARMFFGPASGFAGRNAWGATGRFLGYVLPFLVLAAYIIAWLAKRQGWPAPFHPRGRDVMFLALAMAIGPGLVVNLGMKDHLHRPRPTHVAEFGGTKEFRPFYRFDGGCVKNCSFPSGETSEAFWMMAPASLVPVPWRPLAMAGAVAFGALVGLLRMAFGGHFLSDVVFAALIMWALLILLRWIHYARVT